MSAKTTNCLGIIGVTLSALMLPSLSACNKSADLPEPLSAMECLHLPKAGSPDRQPALNAIWRLNIALCGTTGADCLHMSRPEYTNYLRGLTEEMNFASSYQRRNSAEQVIDSATYDRLDRCSQMTNELCQLLEEQVLVSNGKTSHWEYVQIGNTHTELANQIQRTLQTSAQPFRPFQSAGN